jgi:succinylglutamate desuccinylase
MQAGPTSTILCGVHGNEKCGVEAVQELLPRLSIESGTVFIGFGNPRAIAQNVRFTEANLNRMFKPDSQLTDSEKGSYEYARAHELKKYLDKSDALLDIHASRTPKSRVFAICEDNALSIVKDLPVRLVVSGFDAIQPGGTDYYMNSRGSIGICAECGYLADPNATAVAKKSILAFLESRGHLPKVAIDSDKIKQSRLRMFFMYMTKTVSFKLAQAFEDFEELEVGQLIGRDGAEEIRAPEPCVIVFAKNVEKSNGEAFLLGKYEAA